MMSLRRYPGVTPYSDHLLFPRILRRNGIALIGSCRSGYGEKTVLPIIGAFGGEQVSPNLENRR
jgi:hypothetical protein